jgi:hypothetical protein
MKPIQNQSSSESETSELDDSKPFVCPKCSKSFTLKQALVNHSKIHSEATNSKPFETERDFSNSDDDFEMFGQDSIIRIKDMAKFVFKEDSDEERTRSQSLQLSLKKQTETKLAEIFSTRDCSICLLDREDGRALYTMPCCGTEVHLYCADRCLGSRSIAQRCIVCQTSVAMTTIKDIVGLMKLESRRIDKEQAHSDVNCSDQNRTRTLSTAFRQYLDLSPFTLICSSCLFAIATKLVSNVLIRSNGAQFAETHVRNKILKPRFASKLQDVGQPEIPESCSDLAKGEVTVQLENRCERSSLDNQPVAKNKQGWVSCECGKNFRHSARRHHIVSEAHSLFLTRRFLLDDKHNPERRLVSLPHLTQTSLPDLTQAQLSEELMQRGLSTYGTKLRLINRLLQAMDIPSTGVAVIEPDFSEKRSKFMAAPPETDVASPNILKRKTYSPDILSSPMMRNVMASEHRRSTRLCFKNAQ